MADQRKLADIIAWLRRNAEHYAAEAARGDRHGLAAEKRRISDRFRAAADMLAKKPRRAGKPRPMFRSGYLVGECGTGDGGNRYCTIYFGGFDSRDDRNTEWLKRAIAWVEADPKRKQKP